MLSDEEIDKGIAFVKSLPTRFNIEKMTVDISFYRRVLDQAKAANTLAKALLFYADTQRYKKYIAFPEKNDIWQDQGDLARQSLAECGIVSSESDNHNP